MGNKPGIENLQIADAEIIQHLDSLTEGSSAMFALKDLAHRFVYANKALEMFLEAKTGALIGTTVSEWIEQNDALDIEAQEKAVLQSGKSARAVEHFSVRGKRFSRATVRFPYRDQKGQIIDTGFIAVDIREGEDEYSDMLNAMNTAKDTIAKLQSDVEALTLRATTDSLTGVWNRSQIEDRAKRELAMFQRYAHPVSIVFVDLDHFKQINDTWGHAAGDEVLKGVCDVMHASMRATDLLGRWGGEEFILLLPNTGRLNAQLFAERAREALALHVFPNAGQVTASFGVATCRSGESFDQWIARADALLYRAKSNGRNRVETDTDSETGSSEKIAPSFAGLNWHKAYECGQHLIDQQHRILFDMSNQLLAAVLGGQPKQEITDLINALLAKIVKHFQDEEAIFDKTGFPDAEHHREIHRELVTKAVSLAQRYAEDQLDIGQLFSFLAHEVVAKHMLSDDRKFFPYLVLAA